ncbi:MULTISPECIES: hypothetical protein [unclassified Streptomyces]
MNRSDRYRYRYRARRPNRSRLAETVIATALIAAVVASFAAALYTVLTRP